MSDRRRIRLLRALISTTHGYSLGELKRRFGTHVEGLINALQLEGHVEQDEGERYRLTLAGRNAARPFANKKASAA